MTKPEDTTLNPEPELSFGIISESASESVNIAIKWTEDRTSNQAFDILLSWKLNFTMLKKPQNNDEKWIIKDEFVKDHTCLPSSKFFHLNSFSPSRPYSVTYAKLITHFRNEGNTENIHVMC